MTRATLVLDSAFTVGEIDERLFGSFVEHMGRAVYGGIVVPHAVPGARMDGAALRADLPPRSWNVLRLAVADA
jgi:alpha-L-arabinofuranosidase